MTALVFGKLPAHGDFVARGVRLEERERLDCWLSASLAAARDAWGNGFEERYDRALPCRCEGAGVVGALAASQDAAGRRFPVLVMAADPPGSDAAAGERLEALLYDAIGGGWDADRLAQAAGDPPGSVVERWSLGDGRFLLGAAPADLLLEMLR